MIHSLGPASEYQGTAWNSCETVGSVQKARSPPEKSKDWDSNGNTLGTGGERQRRGAQLGQGSRERNRRGLVSRCRGRHGHPPHARRNEHPRRPVASDILCPASTTCQPSATTR